MKNTKFKIKFNSENTPNTITTFDELRINKLMNHIEYCIKNKMEFNVFISFYDKNHDGSYKWWHPEIEFANYYASRDKFCFIDHSDNFGSSAYEYKILKHIASYEKIFTKKINKI